MKKQENFMGSSKSDVIPLQLVKDFLISYLEKRSLDNTLFYLTDSAEWIGTSVWERASGKQAIKEFLTKEFELDPTPCRLKILSEQIFSYSTDYVSVIITCNAMRLGDIEASIDLRCVCDLVNTADGYKIQIIHNSIPTSLQKENEYFPLSFAQEQLKKTMEEVATRYNTLLQNMSGGFTVTRKRIGEKTAIEFVSDNFCRILGYTTHELTKIIDDIFNGNILNYIFSDDINNLREIFSFDAENSEIKTTYRFRHKDGHYVWFNMVNTFVREPDGSVVCYGTHTDISDLKEKEQKYVESQKKLLAAINHSKLYFWQYNIEKNINVCDLRTVNELGLPSDIHTPEDIVKSGLISPESIEDYLSLYKDMRLGKPFSQKEIRINSLENSWWLLINLTNFYDESGKPISAFATAQNTDAFKDLETRFLVACQQAGMYFWEVDIKNRRLIQSDEVRRFYGNVRLIDNIPEGFDEVLTHPDDISKHKDIYYRIFNGEKSVSMRIRKKDNLSGKWEWYTVSLTAIFDSDGKPLKAIGSSISINETVKTEERYQSFNSFRKLIFKNIIASFRINLTKNTIGDPQPVNTRYAAIKKNGTMDEFLEYVYGNIADEQDLTLVKSIFNRKRLLELYAAGDVSPNLEIRYKLYGYEQLRWIKICIEMTENPYTHNIEGLIYAIDINKEKTSKAVIDRIVDNDYLIMGAVDCNSGKIDYINAKAGTQHVPLEGSLYNEHYKAVVSGVLEGDSLNESLTKLKLENIIDVLKTKDNVTYTYQTKKINGKERYLQWRYIYLEQSKNHILYTRREVTEQFEEEYRQKEVLKTALIQAEQASLAKSEFLSRMSHEIRTPLNAIIGMTAIGAQSVFDADQVTDCLSKIGISARFLLSLINDILDMSRIESGKVIIKKEKIPFVEFVNGINAIIYPQATAKGIMYDNLITSYTEDFYIGDAMKLQQVLVNLLGNAIKFTPTGGKIQLIINQEKITKDYALLKFTVNDTGIGIGKDFLPHIFESFSQEQHNSACYSGTGLGLAICKNYVELMGGKINVHSIEGVGSEFTVTVKLGVTEETKQLNRSKSAIPFEKLSSLFVDDDILVCQHTVKIMTDMNIHAEWVTSGAEALSKVISKRKANDDYNVIFIDWKMPDMDGIQTAKEIRKIVGPEITIIIITAYDWSGIEKEAKKAGVNMLISKPLFKDSLISAFEKIYCEKDNIDISKKVQNIDFKGKRALLVEDQFLNAEIAKKLLGAKNMNVELAENGLEAIEMFAQMPPDYYDVILMDIRMPVMDGLTATRSIRQMKKSSAKTIPIIGMSANAFEEDIEKSKMFGMTAYLSKPIEPDLLYATLAEFVLEG